MLHYVMIAWGVAAALLLTYLFVRLTIFRPSSRATVWFRRWRWGLYDKLRSGHELWTMLESMGIVVFVGPNGSGKSMAAVASALATLDGIPWECDDLSHGHHAPVRKHMRGCEKCTEVEKSAPCPEAMKLGTLDEVDAHMMGCADCEPTVPAMLCRQGDALRELFRTGMRLVYSTVKLLDEHGDQHWRFVPLVDYKQLLTIEHSDVLFDEVAGISDASDSQAMPVQVTNWLHQLRKRDVRLRVTTPAYDRCSKPIRQVAQVVVDARAHFAEPATAGRLWRPRQGFVYRAYDAFAFDEYTATTGKRIERMAMSYFWRPGSRTEKAYNTLDQVLALGHVNEAGMCMVCGGRRNRPTCACAPEVDFIPLDELEVVSTVSASGSRTRKGVVRTVAAPEPLES